MKSINYILFTCVLAIMGSIFTFETVFAQQVETNHARGVTKVAPGELLPISVELSNFGGGKRVDVLVTYGIFTNLGDKIYLSNDTMAVETTANFIKTIQVPIDTKPGSYIAKTSIIYGGQLVPATTQFPFTVERRYFGLFKSEFLLFGALTISIGIFMVFLSHIIKKHYRESRVTLFDYFHIPRDKRIFYEILSDTITSMRVRVGDEALLIASQISGLEIDMNTGRIISLEGHPSKIIASLVAEYEKILGKKVSFSLRKSKH